MVERVGSASVRRAPPRIDETKVSQALQDLFAGWREALKVPFRGITATGAVEPGLFPLRRTGVPTEPLRAAAQRFLDALPPAKRAAASFEIDSEEWHTWSNIHRNLMRHGVCLAELDDVARQCAYDFLRTGLGARAYETARNAMRLNEHLAELTGLPEEFGEYFYWLSVFGEPSGNGPWGWQLDGHHCCINCFIVGDQVVLSPMLLGAEPVRAESGIYKGTTVLREEEAMGWALMASFDAEQQAEAVIGTELPFDGYASGFKDNIVVPYSGLPVRSMRQNRQPALVSLAKLYTDRLPPGHAEIKLAEVTACLDRTWFGWIGEVTETAPFYYRIHSPVIFIEFYHQPGVALPGSRYSRRHAHAMLRTPNGNDYGRALLQQFKQGSSAP